MAELISSIPWSELRKLNLSQLRRLKCYEITGDGEYVFNFVNGKIEETGYLRTQTEYNCETANAVGGETLEEVTQELVEV